MQVSLNIQDDLYQQLVSCGIDIQNEAIKTFKKIVETKPAKSKEFLENQAYFQNILDDIENGDVELVPFEDGLEDLDNFIDNVK
ncbi:MAG: hypothetical protein ABGW74_02580 [Campylobacterales bacterium]